MEFCGCDSEAGNWFFDPVLAFYRLLSHDPHSGHARSHSIWLSSARLTVGRRLVAKREAKLKFVAFHERRLAPVKACKALLIPTPQPLQGHLAARVLYLF